MDAVQLLLDLQAQFFDRFLAELLGKLFVDLRLVELLQLLDLDFEVGLDPLQLLGVVVLGEGDIEVELIAELLAGQLLFKAGDEHPGADLEHGVFALHARPLFAVDRADEVKDDDIVFLDLVLLVLDVDRLCATLCEHVEGVVDVTVFENRVHAVE